jgi:hypothetical protein
MLLIWHTAVSRAITIGCSRGRGGDQTYARPDLAAALTGITRLSHDRYDWSLNDLTR